MSTSRTVESRATIPARMTAKTSGKARAPRVRRIPEAPSAAQRPTAIELGTALHRLRLKRRISQTKFGAPAGMQHQQLSHYENADTGLELDTLMRLLFGNGLTFRDLQEELDGVMGTESVGLEARIVRLEQHVAGRGLEPLKPEVLNQIMGEIMRRLSHLKTEGA